MFRLLFPAAAVVLLMLVSPAAAQFSPTTYNVACNMYAYWVFVPMDRTLVQSWLPSGVEFGSHPFNLSSSVWPVLLEFNNPVDCYVTWLPLIKQSMLEWKLEVPFLKQDGLEGPLMFKPVTYESSGINVLATKLEYGLNAILPQQMIQNNNSNPGQYAVVVSNNVGMIAEFFSVSGQEAFVPASSASYAQPFIHVNDDTEWLGHNIFQQEKCAKIYYQWAQSVVRPVTAHIHFDANFLPNDASSLAYSSEGGIQAIQIQSVEHITSLAACTPSN